MGNIPGVYRVPFRRGGLPGTTEPTAAPFHFRYPNGLQMATNVGGTVLKAHRYGGGETSAFQMNYCKRSVAYKLTFVLCKLEFALAASPFQPISVSVAPNKLNALRNGVLRRAPSVIHQNE